MPEVSDTTAVVAKPRRLSKRGIVTLVVLTAAAVTAVVATKLRNSNESSDTDTVETPAA